MRGSDADGRVSHMILCAMPGYFGTTASACRFMPSGWSADAFCGRLLRTGAWQFPRLSSATCWTASTGAIRSARGAPNQRDNRGGLLKNNTTAAWFVLNAGMNAELAALPDDIICHISPQIWEHINLTGIYDWRGEAQPKGAFRPLRITKEKFIAAA